MVAPIRSGPSGPEFRGTNQDDTLLWDATLKGWYVGAGGGGGAVSSVFGRTGAVVAATGDYDSDQVDNVSSVAGASVSDALETLATPQAAPLRNVLYVDPSATAYPAIVTIGTALTPYNLLQDAIDATTAGEQWTIIIPPGIPIGENIVIPSAAGTLLEIACEGLDEGGIINGTITWNGNDAFFGLTNVYVDDQISGTATGPASTFIAQNCWFNNSLIFSGSDVHLYLNGSFPVTTSFGGNFSTISGNVITTGDVQATGIHFVGNTFNAKRAYLDGCAINSGGVTSFTLSSNQLRLINTISNSIGAVTFSGAPGFISLDGVSLYNWNESDHALTNISSIVLMDSDVKFGGYLPDADEDIDPTLGSLFYVQTNTGDRDYTLLSVGAVVNDTIAVECRDSAANTNGLLNGGAAPGLLVNMEDGFGYVSVFDGSNWFYTMRYRLPS